MWRKWTVMMMVLALLGGCFSALADDDIVFEVTVVDQQQQDTVSDTETQTRGKTPRVGTRKMASGKNTKVRSRQMNNAQPEAKNRQNTQSIPKPQPENQAGRAAELTVTALDERGIQAIDPKSIPKPVSEISIDVNTDTQNDSLLFGDDGEAESIEVVDRGDMPEQNEEEIPSEEGGTEEEGEQPEELTEESEELTEETEEVEVTDEEEITDEQAEETEPNEAGERPDLEQALAFWQDGTAELYYNRDEENQVWVAQALAEPIVLGIYVTNNSDRTIDSIDIVAGAMQATDAGQRFLLTCDMDTNATNLMLRPGESAQIATFTFTGEGGVSDSANMETLSIDLSARYTAAQSAAQNTEEIVITEA